MGIILSSMKLAVFTTDPPKSFLKDFWEKNRDYFKVVGLKIMIPKFIINSIFQFINSLLEILTIFYLSPVYILIVNNFSKIYNVVSILVDSKICILLLENFVVSLLFFIYY